MFNADLIKEEVICWIKEYFHKNATSKTKAIIGISGGKDSTIVAALCVKALGKERVLGVLMPQGTQEDIDISYEVSRYLDIPFIEMNIEKPISSLYDEIKKCNLELNTIASFNTPARVRMTLLYAVSGIVGGRVANTCNLSEDWVGYSTKFGDSAGDFSPLSDFTVTEVKAIGKSLVLPIKFIDKVPIDGLCGKTDEDNLGFSYEILDQYIRHNICSDEKIREKIDLMHKNNQHKINPMPKFNYTISL